MNQIAPVALQAKDFATDQEVRWCPGCGDYAILKGVQKALADIGTPPENVVFVSGIGCAARFPYYIASYGFHTIHGRAPAFATGIKLSNPNLDVWVVSGDGDALSIGGNHLMHVLRRNVDVNYLIFNNEIYGLTKGQYSPTSRIGTRSPSTPAGSVDSPLSATLLALGVGARFVARGIDRGQKELPGILQRAHAHKGASLVEILQNCIVYNDGVFEGLVAKGQAEDAQIHLKHGEPLLFGKDNARGLRLDPKRMKLDVVTLGEDGVTLDDIVVHDETNLALAQLLAAMEQPTHPVAVGVIYCNPADSSYERAVLAQDERERKAAKITSIDQLLKSGATWQVG
ncbi:MAG: 2-oxoacid:ferredoxin oxidoreductase subunit beta [Pseudomonadota bacterium]|nr:2-oxoacid:ferredoxin oxidoreductase subunit beta [Pseudomonadota bacterium]